MVAEVTGLGKGVKGWRQELATASNPGPSRASTPRALNSHDRSMTDDEIFERLCILEPFPAEAVAAAEASYERLALRMIAAFEAWIAASPVERELPNPLFYLFHLLGAHSERRAYRTLARFLRQAAASGVSVLEDAISATAGRVLAHVCDGDPEPLVELVLDEAAEKFVRGQALEAIANATLADARSRAVGGSAAADLGRAAGAGRRAAVGRLAARRRRAATRIAAALVEQGFATGRIGSWTDDEVTFEETLRRKPGDEEDILVAASFSPVSMSEDFVTGRVPYTPSGENGDDFEFAPASMSDEELLRMEHEALADDPFCDGRALDDRGIDDPPRPTPVVDPWRKVGRNDPCPCGSGKKFKKCCAA